VPRQILIILNRAAGRTARAANRLRGVVAALERRGCEVVIRPTRGPGDAEGLARQAEPRFDLVVAAGGDGTVNEVVNGLAGSSRPMAVLPFGTGNVLANILGLPRAPEELARVIAEAPARPIWPARAGDRLCVTMAGVGFDAEVLLALDHRLKRRVGKLAFVLAILTCLWRYRPNDLSVEADGCTYRAASVIVVNGHLYAGRFMIAPTARLDEPLLHMVMFRRAGRLAALRCLCAMAAGALDRLAEVTILPARRVSVAACGPACDRTAPVQIDGEIGGVLPLSIAIADAPLLLVGSPGGTGRSDCREPARAHTCLTQ
jgi:diacylglycerol kinase (ATP)